MNPNGLPFVYPQTIVPNSWDLFVPYFNRLYEQMANVINNKDNGFYEMGITSTAANILNVPSFGAFIICISGTNSGLPTLTASLCKSTSSAIGSIAVLGSQAGSGAWAGINLTITNGPTSGTNPSYFQIAHNRAGVTGNFNINFVGTQGA